MKKLIDELRESNINTVVEENACLFKNMHCFLLMMKQGKQIEFIQEFVSSKVMRKKQSEKCLSNEKKTMTFFQGKDPYTGK